MPASRFAAWAGTRIESGVTGVTETPNPSISAALKVAAEVTRAAEPKVTRVTAPSLSAVEVTQVTQRSRPGLPRKSSDVQCSNPGNPSNPQNEEYPTSPNVSGDPAWWRDFFEERVAIREVDGARPREDADGLAFGDVILEWHHRHGASPDLRRCAGCGDELAGEAGLVLCDGARVHLDAVRGVNCVLAYGQKWRGAAVSALRALGLDPPGACEPL
jgi:hypothetical protein